MNDTNTPPPLDSFKPADAPWPDESHRSERPSRVPTVIAWMIICTIVLGTIAMANMASPADPHEEDAIGLVLMRFQSQYLLGAAELVGDHQREAFYRQAKRILNLGTIPQRQRFIVFAAEMKSPAAAREHLLELDRIMQERERDPEQQPIELTEQQRSVQALLHVLYDHDDIDAPNIAALSASDRALLRTQLGWFGELVLAHQSVAGASAREQALRPARRIVAIALSCFALFGAGLLIGAVVIITWTILLLTGRLRLHFTARVPHHGVYAETFAVWLALLIGLQVLPEIIPALTQLGLAYTMIVFFGSLIALAWPMMRGVSWAQLRHDIGLKLGPQSAIEPLYGALGYLMLLPAIAIGVMIMFALLAIQGIVAGEGDPFGPTGGPAHPIVSEIAHGNWFARVQLLVLAAVAAPIVEEVMFRGVFYRHLRDISRGLGVAGSVVGSALLNAFIFAAIHPQGLVAVPVLMALGLMFVLLREWRDTVVPSIILHALSNGIIVTIMILVVSA